MRYYMVLFLILIALLIIGCSEKEPLTSETQLSSEQPVQNSLTSQVVQPSCPRGVTNDPAPGDCWQYADKNNDGLCDLGE